VPVFTLVIAWIFLGEHPPALGVLGIFIIFVGAYIINLRPDRVRWYDPLKHLITNMGARLSLIVALMYAINTCFLKASTNHGYDEFTVLFAIMAIGWVLLLYVPFTQKAGLHAALRSRKSALFGAAFSSFAGNLFNILAITHTFTSYAIGVRRFDTMISVVLGWKHLKETNIRLKLIGSACMTLGVVVIVLA
jgi:drug/metabolite transporter (DMT)-like permease